MVVVHPVHVIMWRMPLFVLNVPTPKHTIIVMDNKHLVPIVVSVPHQEIAIALICHPGIVTVMVQLWTVLDMEVVVLPKIILYMMTVVYVVVQIHILIAWVIHLIIIVQKWIVRGIVNRTVVGMEKNVIQMVLGHVVVLVVVIFPITAVMGLLLGMHLIVMVMVVGKIVLVHGPNVRLMRPAMILVVILKLPMVVYGGVLVGVVTGRVL